MENFEEKNGVGAIQFIISFCINIIINAYYNDNCLNTSLYRYCISDRVLMDECDKEENLEVTDFAITSCLRIR
jgi:hypothetical protein